MLGIDSKAALKKFEDNLKAEGMPAVEMLAEKVLGALVKSIHEIAAMPGVAPMAMVALPLAAKTIENALKPMVDKIDGQEG